MNPPAIPPRPCGQGTGRPAPRVDGPSLFRQCLPMLCVLLLPGEVAEARGERLSWLENDRIKLGVDLDRGGAITFLATLPEGDNVINNHDLGRQVQLSFYSGPVPYEVAGQKPAEHWRHLGWNPIQSGDDFDNRGRVLKHENDGRRIHLVCQPMQWPLNGVPGDCTFDSWLELEGSAVIGRARLNNARADRTPYPARLQELPAVYANAPFHRVVSYQGNAPFTGAPATAVPAARGTHPWSFWLGTEGWAALLNEDDWGLGLITPGRVDFTGGFAGQPGPNDPQGNSTGYLAGHGLEILDATITYEFRYELVLGPLREIRDRAARHRPTAPPAWHFESDRQGWHHRHLTDAGWPVRGHLDLRLDADHPQLISPLTFWHAGQATHLVIEAAFSSGVTEATVFWQAHGTPDFSPENHRSFPVTHDETFQRHVIPLAGHPHYRGNLVRLRLDPATGAKPGSWMKLRRVELTATP